MLSDQTALLSHLSNNISALLRSTGGDVIAIPWGLLVLTVSPVERAHILKCFVL